MSKMPHIQLDESIHATAAILPGDPARVDAIAAYLEDVKEEIPQETEIKYPTYTKDDFLDEVFMDVTNYLKLYKMTARELTGTIIREVLSSTGITAAAGIGTNLYLCKIAMDIMAKKAAPE